MRHVLLFCLSLAILFAGGFPTEAVAEARSDKIHYIGIYEGKRPKGYLFKMNELQDTWPNGLTWGEHADNMTKLSEQYPGRVSVTVADRDSPVILILTSYEPTAWTVIAETGVEIRQVYLSGYHRSHLVNASEFTVETCFYDDECNEHFSFEENDTDSKYVYDFETMKCTDFVTERYFEDGMKRIIEKFARKPDSLQGAYEGTGFKIDGNTRGDMLKPSREAGYCFKNEDGELEGYDVDDGDDE